MFQKLEPAIFDIFCLGEKALKVDGNFFFCTVALTEILYNQQVLVGGKWIWCYAALVPSRGGLGFWVILQKVWSE